IYCYKAFDKLGKGYASDILFSIENLIKLSSEHNIKILCLPFEQLSYNSFILSLFKDMFDVCCKNNIIPIVPSGSKLNTDGSIMGISTLSNCITVGGLDTSSAVNKPYAYSSCGPYKRTTKPNLIAAASNIVVLNSDSEFISEKNGIKVYPPKLDLSYKTYSGTSLSTAFVSGICALLFEKNTTFNFDDIYSLLRICCEQNDFPKNQQGEGVINLLRLFE
ncbi:MAG: S8 family serine peptidase, partial [Clostridium sp.]